MATVFAVPKIENKVTIAQAELKTITTLRRRIDDLKSELDEHEAEVAGLIKAGAEIEAGKLTAEVKTTERSRVPWKDVVIRELGETFYNRVLSHTKPSVSEKLVIS